jgi:hypothetical protein
MSLLNSASPWTNEDPAKKRIPTMKKPSTINGVEEPSTKHSPLSIDDAASIQENRSSHVNEIINKITNLNAENDGAHLGDFKPLDPPELNKRKSMQDTMGKNAEPQYLLPANPLQHPVQINRPGENANYGANDTNLGNLSNYQQSYSAATMFAKPQQNQPYYAKYGIPSSGSDDKLMERINYMIHLLEQQQQEKTANVTEEFLLYTFLGVFVIYVVDSFSRTGKYTR